MTNRRWWVLLAAAGLQACGDGATGTGTDAASVDRAADDAVPDAAPDALPGDLPAPDVVAPEATPDVVAPDATPDTADAPDVAAMDVAADGGEDAHEAPPDAPVEGDASVDAAPDAPLDAALDATFDATLDATLDASLDATPDASLDTSLDAPLDAAPDACAAGLATCGGACVDLRSDRANCGACGLLCAAGQMCAAGSCTCACPPGISCCAGGCHDFAVDPAHCGACGRACGAGQACVDGACVLPCAASETRCGGRCVDPRTDGANCGACGNACTVAAHGSAACVAGRCAARSCAALRDADPAAPDGAYLLDLDGPGPLEARTFYCNMAGGGWTLVENQVPSAPLPDETGTVNPANFGRVDASWRLGVPDILAVRPASAWKLTDAANAVYFRPACVVDWSVNYTEVMTPHDCTTGYTSAAFTTVVNGGWVYCSARGIGVNNSGRSCSIRGSEGGPPEQGAGPHGRAYSCAYSSTAERVSLWFR